MILGNMRANGVRSLGVSCWQCHHEAVLSADRWPCTRCGIIGADAQPNWRDRFNHMCAVTLLSLIHI